jgi:hypothetical protein
VPAFSWADQEADDDGGANIALEYTRNYSNFAPGYNGSPPGSLARIYVPPRNEIGSWNIPRARRLKASFTLAIAE